MPEKYLLSICYLNRSDIFSEPFGPFESFKEAEEYAYDRIDEMKEEFCDELNWSYEDIEEHFEFDFTIKIINVK